MAKNQPQSAAAYLDEILPMRPGTAVMNDIFELIDRAFIHPWPGQPRTHITAEQIADKRASISKGFAESKGLSKTGIETPLIVRPHPDKKMAAQGHVMLIEGELRWRSTDPVDLKIPLPKYLPCNVRDVTEDEAWEIAAVTGVQREEYTPVQTANIIARYMAGHNKEKQRMSVRDTAARFGKSKSWVSDHLVIADADNDAPQRVKDLIEELQAMVSQRGDTLYHARELKQVADGKMRAALIRRVINERLSLEKLRAEIERLSGRPDKNLGAAPATSSGESGGSDSTTTSGTTAATTDDQSAAGGQSTGSGFDSAATSTRGVTLGTSLPNTPTEKKKAVRANVQRATSFVAEAARLNREVKLAEDEQRELRAELAQLKSNIETLEKELELE